MTSHTSIYRRQKIDSTDEEREIYSKKILRIGVKYYCIYIDNEEISTIVLYN